MQCRPVLQNRRAKRHQCFRIKGFCSKISSCGLLKKSCPAGVCLYACMSVQAFSPLEPKRLVGSGRANTHSMCRNGGKTMLTVSDRSVAGGTCHVRWFKPLQKIVAKGAGQTNGQIRPKFGGPIATMSGINLFG